MLHYFKTDLLWQHCSWNNKATLNLKFEFEREREKGIKGEREVAHCEKLQSPNKYHIQHLSAASSSTRRLKLSFVSLNMSFQSERCLTVQSESLLGKMCHHFSTMLGWTAPLEAQGQNKQLSIKLSGVVDVSWSVVHQTRLRQDTSDPTVPRKRLSKPLWSDSAIQWFVQVFYFSCEHGGEPHICRNFLNLRRLVGTTDQLSHPVPLQNYEHNHSVSHFFQLIPLDSSQSAPVWVFTDWSDIFQGCKHSIKACGHQVRLFQTKIKKEPLWNIEEYWGILWKSGTALQLKCSNTQDLHHKTALFFKVKEVMWHIKTDCKRYLSVS